MSDPSTNGTASTAPKKTHQRIATASFDGPVMTLNFLAGGTVTVDVAKLKPDVLHRVAAYGAANIMQTAYNNSDDPMAAAQACVKKLMSGDWRPGPPRRDAEPDVLVQALADHLHISHVDVMQTYIPRYATKHGLDIGPAKRELRAHPDIAKLIAKIHAERAAKLAATVDKAPRRDLSL